MAVKKTPFIAKHGLVIAAGQSLDMSTGTIVVAGVSGSPIFFPGLSADSNNLLTYGLSGHLVGSLSGALLDNTVAVTQVVTDQSSKVATTQFVADSLSGIGAAAFTPVLCAQLASIYTTGNAGSADWISVYTVVGNNSADWSSTEATVRATSGQWNTQANVEKGNSAYTTTQLGSAEWIATHSIVNAESGDWQGTETTVREFSASWDTAAAGGFTDEDGHVRLTTQGDVVGVGTPALADITHKLTVQGTVSSRDTIYTTTGDSDSWSWVADNSANAGNLNSTYTTLHDNSARWSGNEGDITNLANTSANWDSTHSTTGTYSSDWTWVAQNSAFAGVQGRSAYSTVNLQSGEWNSTWNTLTANSAIWTWVAENSGSNDALLSVYNTVNVQSGEWNSVWNTLTGVSGKWAANEASIAALEADVTNTANASAGWDATETELNLKQPRWDSSYTTLTANSAIWTWVADNSATIYEDLILHGNIVGATNNHLDIKSGKNIRFYLDSDDNSSFCKFQVHNGDGDTIFAIAESGNTVIGGGVVASSIDGITIYGDVSATANVFSSGGNSDEWSSVYTSVTNTSAGWDATKTELDLKQPRWDTSYSVLTANSADWALNAGDVTNLANASAGWNATETELNLKQPRWDSSYTALTGSSGGWDATETELNLKQPRWDTSYSVLTANSADWALNAGDVTNLANASAGWNVTETELNLKQPRWDTSYSVLSATSANWNTAYDKSLANEADITNVANISANWNTAYDKSIANEDDITNLANTSANWNTAYDKSIANEDDITNLATTSANWNIAFVKSVANENDITNIANVSANWNAVIDDMTSVANTSASWNAVVDDMTNVANTSGGWDDTKSTVDAGATSWDTAYTKSVANENDITNVANASAGWDATETELNLKQPRWDTSYSVLTANSADWALNAGDVTNLANASAGWNATETELNLKQPRWDTSYTTLTAHSAEWALNAGDVTNLANASAGWDATETELNLKQPRWDSSYTTLTAHSAEWSINADDVTNLANASGGWNATETELNLKQPRWDSSYTTLTGSSAGWDATETELNLKQPRWDSSYTILTAHSAEWSINADDVTNLANASAGWDATETELNLKQPRWDTSYSVLTAHSADWALNAGDVTNLANASAGWNATETELNLKQPRWDTSYSVLTANSADWALNAGDVTNLANTSADWNSVYAHTNAHSGVWNSTWTTLTANSGRWAANEDSIAALEADMTNVANGSANWNTAYDNTLINADDITNLANASANWNTAYDNTVTNAAHITTVANTSATWNTAYDNTVTNAADITVIASASALWNTAYDNTVTNAAHITTVANTSATWNTAYANTIANAADITVLANTSGNWNAAIDDITNLANASADWNQAIVILDPEQGDLEARGKTAYSTLTANSARWAAVEDDITTIANISGTWDSVRYDVQSNQVDWSNASSAVTRQSGEWDSTWSTLTSYSADWTWVAQNSGSNENLDSVYATVNVLSGQWTDDITNVANASGQWDSTYNTVKDTSGFWSTTYADVTRQIDEWNSTWNTLTATSADWETAYEKIITQQDEWDSTWSTLTSESADWQTAYTDSQANKDDITNLANASAGWDSTKATVDLQSSEWDSTWNTLTANSATWNTAYANTVVNAADITVIANASGTWNTAYDNTIANADDITVIANASGTWNTAYDNTIANAADITTVANTSALWNTAYDNTIANAADITTVANTSALWNTAYDNTLANADDITNLANASADWNTAYADSQFNKDDITNLANASAGWDSTKATVDLQSSEWDSTWNTLTSYSAAWTWVAENSGSNDALLSVYNTVNVQSGEWDSVWNTLTAASGKWAANEASIAALEADVTNVANASADWNYVATNSATGTLTVKESDGSPSISNVTTLEFDSGTGLIVTDEGSDTAKIALGSHWKNINVDGQSTLTPSGEETLEIEAGRNITLTTNAGSSPQKLTIAGFDNSEVTANSADWDSVYASANATSADWDSAYSTTNANSAFWALNAGDVTNLANASGGWDSTKATVDLQSSEWDSTWNTLTSYSATWSWVAENSGSNDALLSVYNTVNVQSGEWDSTWNTLTANSGRWATTEASIAALEADVTNVANASADWNSARTTTNTESGDWEAVVSTVRGQSGDWASTAGAAGWTRDPSNGYIYTSTVADNVTIGSTTQYANNRVTIVGHTSGTGRFYSSGGNSDEWASVFTSVNDTSADWDSVYSSVNLQSGEWDSTWNTLTSNSADWDSVYSSVNLQSGEWDSVWNTLTANSGRWSVNEASIAALEGDVTNVANTSADWDSVYSTVNTNSASGHPYYLTMWDTTSEKLTNSILFQYGGTFLGVGTTAPFSKIHAGGGSVRVDSGYAYEWHKASDSTAYEKILGNSLGYLSFYTGGVERFRLSGSNVGINTTAPNEHLTVAGNISASDTVYSSAGNSNEWNTTYSTVSSQSAGWNSLYSTINLQSAGWDSTWNTLTANSGRWAANEASIAALEADVTNVANISAVWTWGTSNSATIYEDLTLHGNITGPTNDDLDIKSGKNVRVYLDNDNNSAFTKFQIHNGDEDTIFAVAESGNAVIGGPVVASSRDGLTVVGDISASANVFTSGGNSDEWNSVYTAVSDTSALWNAAIDDVTNVANASAGWDATETELNLKQPRWDTAYTQLTATSALWESAYNTVHGFSGTWKSTYEDVILQIDEWDNTWHTLTATSGEWVQAYEKLITQQDEWDSTWTTLTAQSARWEAAYTYAKSNSADITVIASTSADWDSVYAHTNAHSGVWDSTWTTLTANSGRWKTNEDDIDAVETRATNLETRATDLEADVTNVANQSADWDSVYSTVNLQSGEWDSVWNTVTAVSTQWETNRLDITEIANTSAEWDSVYASANATSGDWDSVYSWVNLQSGEWSNTWNTLTANSANWETVKQTVDTYSFNWIENYNHYWPRKSKYITAHNTVSSLSGDWSSVYSTVNLQSGEWDSVWNTLTATSAKWQSNQDDITNLANTSADWDSVYSTVNLQSGEWDSTWVTLTANSGRWKVNEDAITALEADVTNVANASAGWDNTETELNLKQPRWDTSYSLLTANSGDWDSVYASTNATSSDWDSVYSRVNAQSAGWESTWNTLTANSGDWQAAYDSIETNADDWNVAATMVFTNQDDITNIASTSAEWDSVYTSVAATSTEWDAAVNVLVPEGGDVEARTQIAYAALTATSADWDNVYAHTNAHSGVWDSTWTTLTANSGRWKTNEDDIDALEADVTEIANTSADWDSVYSTVNANSGEGTVNTLAKWTTTEKVGDSIISDDGITATVAGSAVVQGNLTVEGDFVYMHTDVSVTSALEVTNHGTGPAVTINQQGTQPVIDIQDDGTSVFKIIDGGNVGIGETSPGKALTVAGDISASGSIYTSNASIIFADGTTFESDDAKEAGSVYSTVSLQSGEWDSTWVTLTANSGRWKTNEDDIDALEADVTEIANTSADWDSVYSTVNLQSGEWDSTWVTLTANSGRWKTNEDDIDALETRATNLETRATNLETRATDLEADVTEIANTSADWDNVYAHTNAHSGVWDSTWVTLTANSGRWKTNEDDIDAVETRATDLEADVTELANTSAEWDSVYSTVNLQSGEWDSVWNTLTANSAKWDANAADITKIANTSADWDSVYSTVNLQSGEWNSVWNTVTAVSTQWETNRLDLTELANTSAEWDSVYSTVNLQSGEWDSVWNTLTANSAGWESIKAQVDLQSGEWDSVWNTLTATSAKWQTNQDDITNVAGTSADWDSVYASANATSADWDSVYASANATSADWDGAYTTANVGSADWDGAYTTANTGSADWDGAYTTANVGSADWDSVYSTVNLQSGEWDSTWNTLTAHSGDWETAHDQLTDSTTDVNIDNYTLFVDKSENKVGIGSGADSYSDLRVWGQGEASIKVQAQEPGGNSYLMFEADGTYGGDITSYNSVDGGGSSISLRDNLIVFGSDDQVIFGSPHQTSPHQLTVAGGLSAQQVIYASGGNSDEWNSVYANTNSTSGNWDSVYAHVYETSGYWSTTYEDVTRQIDEWNNTWHTLTATSGDWVDAYEKIITQQDEWDSTWTTLTATSARWEAAYTYAKSNSADITVIAGTSAEWDSVYSTVNLQSGEWDSVWNTLTATSGDWDSVYSTVNLQSGEWNSVWNTLTATSGDWETAHDMLTDSTTDVNIDSGTLFVDKSTGKVGIGTTAPDNYYYDNLVIYDAATDGGLTIVTGADKKSSLAFGDGTSGQDRYRGRVLYDHDIDTLSLGAGGDLHVHVKSDGKVGIGTNAPDHLLTMHGDNPAGGWQLIKSVIESNHQVGIELNRTESGGSYNTNWIQYINASSKDLRFYSGGNRVTFTDDGNVGIGTTAPGSSWWTNTTTLHVAGSNAAGVLLENTTSGLEFNLASDTTGGVYFDVHKSTDGNDNFFAFRTEDANEASTPTERMRITKDGNVGIGTTGPAELLTVSGNISAKDTLYTNHAYLSGDLDVHGSTTLGNAAADSLTVKSSSITFPDTGGVTLDATGQISLDIGDYSYYMYFKRNGTEVSSLYLSPGWGTELTSQGILSFSSTTGKTQFDYGALNQLSLEYTSDIVFTPIQVDRDIVFRGSTFPNSTYTQTEIARFDASATSLLIANDNKIEFRDATEYIHSSINGQLDLGATTKVRVNAPAVDIIGDITSTANVFSSGGNSDQWSSVYTSVNDASAEWDSVYSTVNLQSGEWDSVWNTLTATSAKWQTNQDDITNLANTSADWDSVYSTVNLQSGEWDSVWNTVTAVSTQWEDNRLDLTEIANTSADWDSVYSTVNTNSGSVIETVAVANSFAVGQALFIAHDGTYHKAIGTNALSAEAIGVIQTATATSFDIVYGGIATLPSHGFTVGTTLFLSTSVEGALTETRPTTIDHINKPMALVVDVDTLLVTNYRGIEVAQVEDPTSTIKTVRALSGNWHSTYATMTGVSAEWETNRLDLTEVANTSADWNLAYTNRWDINNAGEIYTTKNTGIGTTNPSRLLDVYGTFRASGNVDFEGNNFNVYANNVYFSDDKLVINKDGSAGTSIGAGLYVDNGTGNYEAGYIRTSEDGGWEMKEHRTGHILTFGISGTKTIGVSGGLNIEADSAIDQDLTADSETIYFNKLTAGQLVAGEWYDSQWSSGYAQVSALSGDWSSVYSTVNELSSTGTATKIPLWVTDKTTGDSCMTEVTSDDGVTLTIAASAVVQGNLTVEGSWTYLNTDVQVTDQLHVTNAGTGPAMILNQTGAQPVIDIQDDGTSTFYIEDGGNVGISTTDPETKLHINDGDLRITQSDSDNVVLGLYNNTGPIVSRYELIVGVGNTDTGGFGIYESTDESAGYRLYIDNKFGNVGIGTTDPQTNLSVAGNTYTTGFLSAASLSADHVLTREPTAISYAVSGIHTTGNYQIHEDDSEFSFTHTDSNLHTVKTAPGRLTKNGIVRVEWETKVSHDYFVWQIRAGDVVAVKSDGTSAFGSHNDDIAVGEQVLATEWRRYAVEVRVTPGDLISIYMGTANADGAAQTGTGQVIYAKNLRIYSGSPSVEHITTNLWSKQVGIGTTTPAEQLEVSGNTRITGSLSAQGGGYNYFANKVGIGINNPQDLLHLNETDGNAACLGLQKSHDTITVGADLGDIEFKGSDGDGTTDLHMGASIKAQATETWTSANYGTALIFEVSDNTASAITEALRIDQSGYVGIGDTSPDERLTVSGNISAAGSLSAIGGTTNYFQNKVGIGRNSPAYDLDIFSAAVGGSTLRLSCDRNDGYGKIHFGPKNDSYDQYGATIEGTGEGIGINVGDLRFSTGFGTTPVERMRIKSSGYVGIGTTSPNYRFDVEASEPGSIISRFWNLSDTGHGIQIIGGLDASGVTLLDINNKDGDHVFTVRSNGSVGIGVDLPGQALEVAGDTTTYGKLSATGDTCTSGSLSAIGTLHYFGGKVGIGTNNPAVTFEVVGVDAFRMPAGNNADKLLLDNVAGYFRFNTDTGLFEGNDGTEWTGVGGVIDADQDTRIGANETEDDDTLRFFTNGTQNVAFLSGGNVIVGTATPGGADYSEKLTVSGNISAAGSLSAIGGGYNYFANRVGIGTASPTDEVHIKGPGPGLRIENTQAGALGINLVNTAREWQIGSDNSVDNFYILDVTTAASRFCIRGDSGKIGIGTLAPSYALHVATGDIFASGNIIAEGTYFKLGAATGPSSRNRSGNLLMANGQGFTSVNTFGAVTLDSGGEFALTTASVSASHIHENVHYVKNIGTSTGVRLSDNIGLKAAQPGVHVLYGYSANTAVSGDTQLTINGTAEEIEIDLNGSTDTTTFLGSGGNYTIGLPNKVTIDQLTTSTTLSAYDGLSATGLTYFGGNVGIGITNPGVSFVVGGSDAMRVPVGDDADRPDTSTSALKQAAKGYLRFNTTSYIFEAHNGGTWFPLGGTSDADQDTKITAEGTPGSDDDIIRFQTVGVERMRIEKLGNVAISTTVPMVSGLTLDGHLSASGVIWLSAGKTSDQWSSVYTSVNDTSAEWDSVYSQVNDLSGNWHSTYATMTAVSSQWDANRLDLTEVANTSAEWDSVYTSVNDTSSYWDTTYTTVHGYSGLWGDGPELGALSGHSNATYIATFSAETLSQARKWNSGVGYWSTNNLASFDNTKVNNENYTDISFNGAGAQPDDYVQLDTGQPLHGTKAAFTQVRIWAQSSSDAHVWTVQYSDDSTTWATIDGASVTVQNGSGTGTWTYSGKHRYWRLINKDVIEFPIGTVNYYEIQFYESILVNSQVADNSTNWNAVYSTVGDTSGRWESVYSTVNLQSGEWDSTWNTLTANSGDWVSAWNTLTATSGRWNSAYTTADANSADITNLANASGDWDSVYSTVNLQSGEWDSVWNTVTAVSTQWETNRLDLTELANTSADWDNVYTQANAYSGTWTSVWNTVTANSGVWNHPLSGFSVGETITSTIGQLTAGSVVRKCYDGTYERSLAGMWPRDVTVTTDVLSAEVLGVVQWSDAAKSGGNWSGDNFDIVYSGICNLPDHSYGDPGATLFLSCSTLGVLTSACPVNNYDISKPVGTVIDADTILVQPLRGHKITIEENRTDEWNSAFSTVKTNSAAWLVDPLSESVYKTVSALSADWNSVYSTVNVNSGAGTTNALMKWDASGEQPVDSSISDDGSTVTITGNLDVNGTTTTIDTANLSVKDHNILLNDGGTTAGTKGAGITFEGDSAAEVGYIRVGSSDNTIFELNAPGNAFVLTVDVNATETLTIGGSLDVEADSAINQDVTTDAAVTFGKLNVANPDVPSSATATGTKGDIAYDNGYIYVCVATNTWRRSVLTTWT